MNFLVLLGRTGNTHIKISEKARELLNGRMCRVAEKKSIRKKLIVMGYLALPWIISILI
jgi:hypothetical protein